MGLNFLFSSSYFQKKVNAAITFRMKKIFKHGFSVAKITGDPTRKVILHNVRIYFEEQGKQKQFLKAKQIELRFNLFKIVFAQEEIKSIIVKSGEFYVSVLPDGFNLRKIFGNSKSTPVGLTLFKNCRVLFSDLINNREFLITNVEGYLKKGKVNLLDVGGKEIKSGATVRLKWYFNRKDVNTYKLVVLNGNLSKDYRYFFKLPFEYIKGRYFLSLTFSENFSKGKLILRDVLCKLPFVSSLKFSRINLNFDKDNFNITKTIPVFEPAFPLNKVLEKVTISRTFIKTGIKDLTVKSGLKLQILGEIINLLLSFKVSQPFSLNNLRAKLTGRYKDLALEGRLYNRKLEILLKGLIADSPVRWRTSLDLESFCYNFSIFTDFLHLSKIFEITKKLCGLSINADIKIDTRGYGYLGRPDSVSFETILFVRNLKVNGIGLPDVRVRIKYPGVEFEIQTLEKENSRVKARVDGHYDLKSNRYNAIVDIYRINPEIIDLLLCSCAVAPGAREFLHSIFKRDTFLNFKGVIYKTDGLNITGSLSLKNIRFLEKISGNISFIDRVLKIKKLKLASKSAPCVVVCKKNEIFIDTGEIFLKDMIKSLKFKLASFLDISRTVFSLRFHVKKGYFGAISFKNLIFNKLYLSKIWIGFLFKKGIKINGKAKYKSVQGRQKDVYVKGFYTPEKKELNLKFTKMEFADLRKCLPSIKYDFFKTLFKKSKISGNVTFNFDSDLNFLSSRGKLIVFLPENFELDIKFTSDKKKFVLEEVYIYDTIKGKSQILKGNLTYNYDFLRNLKVEFQDYPLRRKRIWKILRKFGVFSNQYKVLPDFKIKKGSTILFDKPDGIVVDLSIESLSFLGMNFGSSHLKFHFLNGNFKNFDFKVGSPSHGPSLIFKGAYLKDSKWRLKGRVKSLNLSAILDYFKIFIPFFSGLLDIAFDIKGNKNSLNVDVKMYGSLLRRIFNKPIRLKGSLKIEKDVIILTKLEFVDPPIMAGSGYLPVLSFKHENLNKYKCNFRFKGQQSVKGLESDLFISDSIAYNVNLAITGKVSKPVLNGELRFSSFKLKFFNEVVSFKPLLRVENNKLIILPSYGKLTGNKFKVTGFVRLIDNFRLWVNIVLNSEVLNINYQSRGFKLQGKGIARVVLRGKLPDLEVSGELILNNTQIKGDLTGITGFKFLPGKFSDFKIVFNKNCKYSDERITTTLKGKLKLNGSAKLPLYSGQIYLEGGFINYCNREFKITDSSVSFKSLLMKGDIKKNKKLFFKNDTKKRVEAAFKTTGKLLELKLTENNLLPEGRSLIILNINAETKIGKYLVLMKITGDKNNPVINLSSIPGMDKRRIIALLIGGDPDATAYHDGSLNENEMFDFISGDIKGQLFNRFSQSLSRKFKLNEFRVSSSTRKSLLNGSVLKIGKYLNEDVYLKYTKGLSVNTEDILGVEYKLKKRILLEGQFKPQGSSKDLQLGIQFMRTF